MQACLQCSMSVIGPRVAYEAKSPLLPVPVRRSLQAKSPHSMTMHRLKGSPSRLLTLIDQLVDATAVELKFFDGNDRIHPRSRTPNVGRKRVADRARGGLSLHLARHDDENRRAKADLDDRTSLPQ